MRATSPIAPVSATSARRDGGAAAQSHRTLYRFDVRDAEEYAAGHLPGFRHYPGGQLVQETDMAAPVRGARILLTDDHGRPRRHDGVLARADGLGGLCAGRRL